MRQEFNVPLLPYLKKYVEKQFFAGLTAPYKIEEDTLLGKQFMSLLMDCRTKDLRGDKKIEMSATLPVLLSEELAKRSATLPKLIPINYYLDKLFKAALIAWIQCSEELGVRPFNSSKSFLAYYKIEEAEYSHDAAYKVYLRHKQQGYQPKPTPKIIGQQRTKVRASTSV